MLFSGVNFPIQLLSNQVMRNLVMCICMCELILGRPSRLQELKCTSLSPSRDNSLFCSGFGVPLSKRGRLMHAPSCSFWADPSLKVNEDAWEFCKDGWRLIGLLDWRLGQAGRSRSLYSKILHSSVVAANGRHCLTMEFVLSIQFVGAVPCFDFIMSLDCTIAFVFCRGISCCNNELILCRSDMKLMYFFKVCSLIFIYFCGF